MTTKELNEHEALFCRYYVKTHSAREAAARAGYWTNPERSGFKLMARLDIQAEIERLSEKIPMENGVTQGLARLAFGGVADAIRLMRHWEDMSDEELERLDLFCVSEVKQLKGGGLEMKFHDRMEAMQALRESSAASDADRAIPFYKALEQSVAAVCKERE